MGLYHYNSMNLELEHQRIEPTKKKVHAIHSHAYFEVCCIHAGQAVYHIEGSEYFLQPGDIVVIRPGEAHYIQVIGGAPLERSLLSFGQSFFKTVDPERELAAPFFDRESGHQNLYRSADFPDLRLRQHFIRMEQKVSRFHLISQLFLLLQDLNLAFPRLPNHEQRRETMEASIIRLIDDNYHLELSLQELSDRFFISRAQLCRRFQKATGVSIGRYVTIKRLNAARQLLLQGRKASDVSTMCGFKDYSTFYRAYTRHFGCSPTGK